MSVISKEKKQNSEKSSCNPKLDGYNAEELGEQSSYEDETEIAQRIRRGNSDKEKGDERDVLRTQKLIESAKGQEEKKLRTLKKQ